MPKAMPLLGRIQTEIPAIAPSTVQGFKHRVELTVVIAVPHQGDMSQKGNPPRREGVDRGS